MKTSVTTIRTRLILIVVAAVTAAQAIGLGLSLWHELTRYADAKRDTLVSTAEVIAAAAARATAERDIDAGYQAIRAMGRIAGITYAGIERADGTPLADVGATEQLVSDLVIADPAAPIPLLALLASRSVETNVGITYGGVRVGSLKLIADTRDLPARMISAIGMTALGGLAALALALALALRLQGAITGPLRALTRAMSEVGRRHDYSRSLPPPATTDEVGVLIAGYNAMIADIRARDQMLARHRAQLETEVAARTDDFRAAAAEADAANRAKSDFLATMSHEIRTPMNGILVMAELLAATDLPKRARRQAEVIARSGQSLLAIINDILDLSKIEAGKLETERLEIDPGEAVDTVLRLFADRAQGKGLDLAANLALPRAVRVLADPVRLGQVLGNLVNNALKFTETGSVIVTVELAHGRARFSVADTGIGIAPDKLATIFDAFSQADQTTTRRFGGTGLGLSIAKRLVEAMGGALTVESTPGIGTRFGFSLPLAPGTPAAEPAAEWPVLAPVGGRLPRAVLCLDGSATRNVAQAYLQAAGAAVEIVDPEGLSQAGSSAMIVLASASALAARAERVAPAATAIIALTGPQGDGSGLMETRRADALLGWPLLRAELAEILRALRDGQALATLDHAGAAEQAAAPHFAGLRVLVADDNSVNREVAQAALNTLGIQPDFAQDGLEAVAAVAAQRFDLVLMDGSMPHLDGFAATRRIRAAEAGRASAARLPIVALTAHVVGTAANAWREAGMDGVLHKPFTIAQLAACLAAHTNGTEAPPAIEPARRDDTPGEKSLLDRTVLDELRAMAGDSPEIVARIVRLYRDQAHTTLDALFAAQAAGDLDRLGALAHAMKSMSYNVGARSIAAAAGRIEADARIASRAASADDLAELGAELALVQAELASLAA